MSINLLSALSNLVRQGLSQSNNLLFKTQGQTRSRIQNNMAGVRNSNIGSVLYMT